MGSSFYLTRYLFIKFRVVLIIAVLFFGIIYPASAGSPDIELARILEGEASFEDCGFLGLIAVAHVYSRNSIMYGYAKSSPQSRLVAEVWESIPDPTHNSTYIFGEADLQKSKVRSLVSKEKLKLKLRVRCNNGDLFAYGK